jgi:hypothetical protein
MSGLRVALLAFAICGVLAIPYGTASGAGSGPAGSVSASSTRATARGPDVSEVDAFLGTSRSTRIAQIIPDHARACLPSGGGFRTTEAQRGIAAVAEVVAESPLGAWLLDQATARLVLICQDPNTDLAAYYRWQMRLIGLFDRLGDPARIMFLAHELAHVPQHPRYSNDLRFGPEAMLVMHRMREATAEAVATRVLWQLRVRGLRTVGVQARISLRRHRSSVCAGDRRRWRAGRAPCHARGVRSVVRTNGPGPQL